MDILSELTQLKADFSAAQGLLEEAKHSGESLAAQLAEKDSAVAAKLETISALTLTLSAKDKELGELQGQLAELKAKEKTAEQKAVELVANVGIKAMKADYSKEAAVKDKAEVIATIHSLKDPIERAQYYFANKAVLFPG
jgi:chromosome segregation ATPase